MQKLVLFLIPVIFLIEFATGGASGGRGALLRIAPEGLSGLAAAAVILRFGFSKTFDIHPKYLLFFLFVIFHLLGGIVINSVTSGALVGGLRLYFKYIPFFLLPMVYVFSEDEIRQQVKLLLVMVLLQIPIAFYQRFVSHTGIFTGDNVRGTLDTSSALSIMLICAMAWTLAFYKKNLISKRGLTLLLLLFFIPTTLNETKATVILIPMALMFPLIFMKGAGAKEKKQLFSILILSIALLGVFSAVYKYMYGSGSGDTGFAGEGRTDVFEFFTDPDKLVWYLANQTSGRGKETTEPGRVDRIVAPFIVLSEDPVKLMVGLGMGNVSKTPVSFLGGEYTEYIDKEMADVSISWIVWEMGIIGAILAVIFLVFIFNDSRALSAQSGIVGAIGLGWIGVTSIMFFSIFYKDVIPMNAIMYLFWYWSGFIVATRVRIGKEERRKLLQQPVASGYGVARESTIIHGKNN